MMHKHSARKSPSWSASIVGARGYSGLELAKILLQHPAIQLTHCFATRAFQLADEIFTPAAEQVQCLTDEHILENLPDVVFLATPAEVSHRLAPQILNAGKKVIDLSGAFRLKHNDNQKWYGLTPNEPELAAEAQYGLVPFCGPATTRFISNPGCYATSVAMALVPLLKKNLIESSSLMIDAKSGTSGAGRKADENLIFSEVNGGCLPYRVGKHQHLPEICEAVQAFSGQTIDPHFVTHLLPVSRGIISGLYATAKTSRFEDIQAAYDEIYRQYPLVRHGNDIARLAKIQPVVGTAYTHISYTLTGNKLYVFSVIDNLMKGAASQAVENLNRMLDLPLTTGLIEEE